MWCKYYYWYFKSALSDTFCDKIINIGLKKTKKLGTIGNLDSKKNKKIIIKKRFSDVVFFEDPEIDDVINSYLITANKNSSWNFNLTKKENNQFTIYGKKQFYHWHTDHHNDIVNDPSSPFHNTIRKVSMTIQLSDPKNYKGGNLEFCLPNSSPDEKQITKATEILPRGTITFFPSFVWHRVTPVTKGTRYSLVTWFSGETFK
jgi:PKHD-type hydroxylase